MIKIGNASVCENCFSKTGKEPCPVCGYNKNEYFHGVGILPVGSVLADRFLIGQMIGQGGFGITYRAYDKNNDKVVAIKEYYPNSMAVRNTNGITVMASADDNETVFRKGIERFYEEAKLVSRFNGNPNIVSVYDCFYENDTAYLVMEFLKGRTLKEYVNEKGVLSPEEALFVLSEMSNALMIAHSAKVLHRDISPDNIMLCEDGSLKLIDFGAARQVMADNPKSMSVILKSGFAPLEQYQRRGNQGPWTDIYSLGATVYYLMTKESFDDPVTRLDDDGVIENTNNIEPQLWNIIERSVKLKSGDRYQNAFELRDAIEKVDYKPAPIKPDFSYSFSSAAYGGAEKTPDKQAEGTVLLLKNVPVEVKADDTTLIAETQDNSAAADTENKTKKFKMPFIAAGVAAFVLIVAVAVAAIIPRTSGEDISVSADNSVTAGTTAPPKKTETKKTTAKKAKETTAKKPKETTADEPKEETTTVSTGTTAAPREMITIGKVSFYTDATEVDLSSEKTGKKLTNSDLDFLPKMTKLQWLLLNDNNISDLSVLSDMTELKGVWFPNNKVSDISFVRNMDKLQKIDGINNGIKDISALKDKKFLTEVWLGENNITDLSPLKNCTNVKYLNIDSSQVKSIDAVTDMKLLKEIYVTNCGITDISPLAGHTDLEKVYMGNERTNNQNQIKSLSPLKDCTKIKELVVNWSPINNIDVVNNMPNLEFLNVTQCSIADISPLQNCKKLKYVLIGANHLNDVSALQNAYGLNCLNVGYNEVSDANRDKYLESFAGIHFLKDSELYLKNSSDDNSFWFYSKVEAEEFKDTLKCDGELNFYYNSRK